MAKSTVSSFVVRKDDLHRTDFVTGPETSAVVLEPGQVLLRTDTFAFTANNVTYAVFGAAMRYWDFYPAGEGREDWGIVPVWGYAVVERSEHPDIRVGERVFGYLPMATHFVVSAGGVHAAGFVETAAHRSELAAIYNQYSRCDGDPGYDADHENEQMLLRVLFLTGWLIDDFLGDQDFFGARSVVVSSASSKTSIGLAWCLHQRGKERCEVVGLTSEGNRAFVEGLGCYHRVVTYDEVADLPVQPSVFVDMAGNAKVTRAVHERFGDDLRYSCSVGGTHWDNLAFGEEFPGPTPTLFFAPSQVEKRTGDWGAAGLAKRMAESWARFLPRTGEWLQVERLGGPDAVRQVYLDTLEGRADPKKGYVLGFEEA